MYKKNQSRKKFFVVDDMKDNGWIKRELGECKFKDARLNKRLQRLCRSLYAGIGESIPYACQDWANTKAAYRFFSNEGINEEQILSGHFLSTKERATESQGNILILHDTTEFKYKRDDLRTIGLLTGLPKKRDLFGKLERITTHGVLMHSSLAVTTSGLPLGLAAIKFFTRKKFIGANELKRHINPTPADKSKYYPKLQLTVIHAKEKGKPKNRDKIMWKLLTDLPVTSLADAIEKLNWYAMRWKIELFHKILKSGCKAESSKLRTANRITNLIAIFCILSWRIFWICDTRLLLRVDSIFMRFVLVTRQVNRRIYPRYRVNLWA